MKNMRMTACPKGQEIETEMLLDLLDAATGLKLSFANMGDWQVMDESDAGGESAEYFWWQLGQYPRDQWFPTTIGAAHACLDRVRVWREAGCPRARGRE